jgi:hypothetical protein
MAAHTIIYGLSDPMTNELRYVGKTARKLSKRLSEHIYSPKRNNCKSWIKSLNKKGHRPEIFEIERYDSQQDGSNAEVFLISYFKSIGCRLTNLTKGGEGVVGYKCTKEQTERRRKKAIGNKSRTGIKESPEQIKRKSEILKERYNDPIYRAKQKARHQGEKNNNSKLTWWQVAEIRHKYKTGMKCKDILKDYPIKKSMFWCIVSNKNWRN